jgi:hypothetical protein
MRIGLILALIEPRECRHHEAGASKADTFPNRSLGTRRNKGSLMKFSRLRFLIVNLMIILCMWSFTDSLLYAGDIVLTGNDVMTIENTTYTQTGNIYVQDNAKLTIRNTTLIMNMSYHEEFSVWISGNATLEIINSTISNSIVGENIIMMFFDQSTLTVTNSDLLTGLVYLIFGGAGGGGTNPSFQGNAFVSGTSFQNLDFNISIQGAGGVIHLSDIVYLNSLSYNFGDGYTGSFSNLKPGYLTSWKYNENGYNLTIENATIGIISAGCVSACNVTFQNCELFALTANSPLSTIRMKATDSIIQVPTLHSLWGVTASFWGLKPGLQSNFKLSEHSQGLSLPEIILENTEVKLRWEIDAFSGSNISVDDSTLEHRLYMDNANSKITNSTIVRELMFYGATNSTIEFDNTIIENLDVYVPPISVTMKGNVTFANNAKVVNWYGPSTVKRNCPVTITGNLGSNLTVASLSLYDKAGTLVWSGQTDTQGKANFDIEFNDDNHNDNWNLAITYQGKTQNKTISLLTSTPIQISPIYQITAAAGSNGSITPSGAVTVSASQTFTITPDRFNSDRVTSNSVYPDGSYQVADVLVDGVSVGAVTSYTFSNVQADHTISATFVEASPSATALIYDNFSGSGIDTAKWTVNDQNNVFSVSGGYLNANSASNSSEIYHGLTSKQTFSADFDIVLPYKDFQTTASTSSNENLIRFGIQVNTSTGRSADVRIENYYGAKSFYTNSTLTDGTWGTFTATATSSSGWLRTIRTGSTLNTYYREDDKWNLLGTLQSFTGEATWNIYTDFRNSGTFHVSFDGIYSPNDLYYTLTITKSGSGTGAINANTGTISWTENTGTASYNPWTSITLTATPDAGSTFTGWSGGGCTGTGTCTVTMSSAQNVTAMFTESCTYSLSTQQSTADGLGATGTAAITAGSSCNRTAVSNASWITVTNGATGSGNGTISYSVAANTTGSSRTGTITIGGQTFTITQAYIPTYSNYVDIVQKFYIGYYQRPADPVGLIYWAARLNANGGDFNQMIAAFANSPESQTLYGNITSDNISTVVNNIYLALLSRTAEPEGLNWWASAFNAHQFTAATIMLNILYAAAPGLDLQSVNNKLTAANLFTRTIDPELGGRNLQATFDGSADNAKARQFLTAVTSSSSTIPPQSQVTAYIRANIADAGDPINNTTAISMSSPSYDTAQVTSTIFGFSRSTPYPRNQVVSAPIWDITVRDIVRGDTAWRAIYSANPLTEPAPAGMEYLLVKIQAQSIYADRIGHYISKDNFRVTGDRLISYPHASVVPPEPLLTTKLTDSETEGWIPYLIGIGEGNLILIYDELLNTNEQDLRFIALDEGASISVDPKLATILPTDIGKERTNPAPLRQKMINEDWEITMEEVIRGDAVWKMVYAANQENRPPADGREYIAVRIHLKYISTKDTSVSTKELLFWTTGNLNFLYYERPSVIAPSPNLDATLFPGGETEGWVVLQVTKGEEGIILVIDVQNDSSGTEKRFVSLER